MRAHVRDARESLGGAAPQSTARASGGSLDLPSDHDRLFGWSSCRTIPLYVAVHPCARPMSWLVAAELQNMSTGHRSEQ